MPLAPDGLQHHEVAHIPVQDGRQAQLPQILEIQAERTADEAQLARDLDERPQGHAVKRHRVTAAKRVQIDAVPMERGHHGKAGEPAFGRLRLADQWKAPSAAEVQLTVSAHIRTLRSGVVSQLMRDRLSRMMSALRSMSGWSATRLP